MQKLQLYIDINPTGTTTYEQIDLFKDETVSMTRTIQNVKDISKIFTEFTKTFTIPASKTNNKIFKHYYNFGIGDNTDPGFDARKKRIAKIELNSVPFQEGYIKLEGAQLKKNKPNSYKITFFGKTVNLKDILGDDELSSLDTLNANNLDYNYTNIASKIYNAPGVLCAPLITHTRQLYFDSTTTGNGNLYWAGTPGYTNDNGVWWSDLKFALRLYDIIQAIQTDYGITFSTDFFDTGNADFYNLYLWLHRKKGDVEPAGEVSLQYQQVYGFTAYSTPSPETTTLNGAIIISSDLVTFPNYITSSSLSIFDSSGNTYNVRVFRNGSLYYQAGGLTGNQVFNFGSLSAGNYTVSLASATSYTISTGDIRWDIAGQKGESVSSWSDEWRSTSSLSLSSTFEFVITEQIPKMKIIDFLTGLFKLFNLTAYVNSAGTIVVKTLDSYYSSAGNTWDIDDYVDTNTSTIDVALPFKDIKFKYRGTGTYLAKQYNQLFNSDWGALSFSLDNAKFDAPEKSYTVEVPFEHMQYERLYSGGTATDTQYGWCVDDNKQSYYGQPIIFYAIRQTSATDISLKQSANANAKLTAYVIPSNSQSLTATTSAQNINFINEKNEYRSQESTAYDFTDTLFEKYYTTYVTKIFNNRRRITKVSAYLPLKMVYNLELNDNITLYNNQYDINSVTIDLTTGKSSIELLNDV